MDSSSAGFFRFAWSCFGAVLLAATFAGPATADSTPKCRGLKATIWSKSDAPKTIVGTAGRDVIVTGNGDDRIWGKGGGDVICSGGGADLVKGGTGFDRIYSGSGDDFIAGDDGDDVLCAYGGRDAAFGGRGDDWISVGRGINLYSAEGKGYLNDQGYRYWVAEGYTRSYGSGSSGDDAMTGRMIHVKGAKLEKKWHC